MGKSYRLMLCIFLFCTTSLSLTAQYTQTEPLRIVEIPTPSLSGGESNLFVDDRGVAWLSWVEYLNDSTDVLMHSALHGNQWSVQEEIARGSDWFVNWADFPSLAVFPNSNGQKLLSHWLQKSAAGKFDYDVLLRLKQDSTTGWGNPFLLNRDGIAAEHGFVTLFPESPEKILAVWLDGRHTKTESQHADHAHDGHHGGPMSLRSAVIHPNGSIGEEVELDAMVCDCCQTDITFGTSGPIVVYRNRSEKEIRDIYVTRRVKGVWSKPKPVFRDKWMIAGCPVNGPAVSAKGNNVAVAWYTGTAESPKVLVSFSQNNGKSFSKAIQFHESLPLGRVDIEWIDDQQVLVSWMEQKGEKAMIRVRKVSSNGKIAPPEDIMTTENTRASGFPVLVRDKLGFLLSATYAAGNSTRIRTFRLLLTQ